MAKMVGMETRERITQFNIETVGRGRRAFKNALIGLEEKMPPSYQGKINQAHLGTALLLWLGDQDQEKLWGVLGSYMDRAAELIQGATKGDQEVDDFVTDPGPESRPEKRQRKGSA